MKKHACWYWILLTIQLERSSPILYTKMIELLFAFVIKLYLFQPFLLSLDDSTGFFTRRAWKTQRTCWTFSKRDHCMWWGTTGFRLTIHNEGLLGIFFCSQVYEHITYDCSHVRFCTFEGMWNRTLTVSSSGKTLSCTGWKIG